MKYEFLTNVSLEEALQKLKTALKSAGTTYRTELTDTRESCGRICTQAQYAKRSSPHYLSCAMDGIALRSELLETAGENTPVCVAQGDYTMVDTGDPLPKECDSVVMIEDVVFDEQGNAVLYAPVPPWSNVRQIGEDISMGDMIIPSFTKITPALIGALLAGGVFQIEVVKTPVAAVIPTGDEIVSADAQLTEGDIPEYNSAIFSAMLKTWGVESIVYPVVPDDPEQLKKTVQDAVLHADAVITIAGSSAGRDDYTSRVLSETGELIVHGIAVKPGKPAVLGHIGDKPFFGVPGYPVSGIIIMEEIVRPILCMLTKEEIKASDTAQAVLTRKVPSSLKYREYIRVRAAQINDRIAATPLPKGAGIVSGFAKADALVLIDQDSEGYEASQTVNMQLLKPYEKIAQAICITGSHDPLIDEISDILARKEYPVQVVSAHVGSMGAIHAVRSGSAHMGGVHLLDPDFGSYNIPYLKKYFPKAGAVLIRGVVRLQGLMITPGNPLQITGVKDLSRVSYVNRQKGAGTRVLLDYLLQKEGMDPREVKGYDREEYTHTAVAAAIAAGTADCGMGIYSAARIYGLDFLPVWNEEYDFLVDEAALKEPKIREFIEVLKSEEFQERLNKLGGYVCEQTGQIRWSSATS